MGVIIFWVLYEIPFILFYQSIVSPSTGLMSCVINNGGFQKYLKMFHLPVLTSSLPVTIITIFGILAYRNIQHIAYRTVPLVRRELDKQLTVMVLVHVLLDVVAVTPTMINNIYSSIVNTPTDPITVAQLSLITNIVTLIYYVHFVVCIDCVMTCQ